jgi:NADH:ubiquinone oxidoreductase subunit C
MSIDQIAFRLAALPGATPAIVERGELWMRARQLDVVAMATTMAELGARLSTMTGVALPDGETDVLYHYWLAGHVATVAVQTSGNHITSITQLCPAAAWAEREIHDYYAVTFVGHPVLERLLLPDDMPTGLYRDPS